MTTKTHNFTGFMDFKPCNTYIVENHVPNYETGNTMVLIYHKEGNVDYKGTTCILVDKTKHLELI